MAKSVEASVRDRWLTAGQTVLAAALPWLLASWGAPWWALVLALAAVVAYCARERGVRGVWLLVPSAALSMAPAALPLPAWFPLLTAVLAAACAGVVVVGLARRPAAAEGRQSRALAALAWGLVAMGALTAGVAVAAEQAQERTYARAQAEQADAFRLSVEPPAGSPAPPATGAPAPPAPPTAGDSPIVGSPPVPSDVQTPAPPPPEPVARLSFRRPGTDVRPVTAAALMVGADISDAGLARGPGHYPTTALPGRAGNMAVAGHRTGWGSPFLHLDDLRAGDEIVVDDRRGRTHVYTVAQVLLVEPDADWVLRPDPMGTGQRTLTLTTCDPPWLNSRRLIVFAVLDDGGSGPPVA